MKNKNYDCGFALVEVLISLIILVIVLFAFMTAFTFAFTNVYGVGRKGVAINTAQSDLEKSVAQSEAIDSDALEIDFNGTLIIVPGGIAETTKEVGDRKSKLETFLPMVPTISINPKVRFEGSEPPVTINVTGKATNFSSGQTSVQLLDRTGTTVLATISPNVISEISATFILPNHLVNVYSDYIIRMITPISGAPDEVVRARFSVHQPRFVAIGGSHVYVSESGTYWFNRSGMLDFPSLYNLNDITTNGSYYLAVGNAGLVLKSRDQQTWVYTYIAGIGHLNGVTWSPHYARFYAVSSNGNVYYSSDGLMWTFSSTGISESLSSIAVSSDGYIVAVGESGKVITSTNGGLTWSVYTLGSYNFNDVTVYNDLSANIIVAVGDNGIIVNSSIPIGETSVSWGVNALGATDILSVHNNLGFYILVGADGLIGTTTDPTGLWTMQSIGTENLNGVFALPSGLGDPSKYIAVGSNGTVLYSEDTITWSSFTFPGIYFAGIVGR